jgi:hypothetical protein
MSVRINATGFKYMHVLGRDAEDNKVAGIDFLDV